MALTELCFAPPLVHLIPSARLTADRSAAWSMKSSKLDSLTLIRCFVRFIVIRSRATACRAVYRRASVILTAPVQWVIVRINRGYGGRDVICASRRRS